MSSAIEEDAEADALHDRWQVRDPPLEHQPDLTGQELRRQRAHDRHHDQPRHLGRIGPRR